MQYISIYDKNGVISKQIYEMSFWKKRQDLVLNKSVLTDSRKLIHNLQKIKPNVFIMIIDNTDISTCEGIRLIKKKLTGINIICVGYDNSYETVRKYFHSGVFDYLIFPLEEETLLDSVLRVYMGFGLDYILNDLQLKVDALIENIFVGGGQEEYIINNIMNQIYRDWKNDPLNCQIISDKAKYHIYEMLIERKSWLEKFLYRNDFSYHLGFSVKTKEEIMSNWLRCFKEASAMVTKYQMIDDKLVYHIGKYVVVHVDEKLSLDTVAQEVFLNPSYVSHIFKKITGMSFTNFITEVKIDRAKVLLRDNNIRIYDVANILGFNNPEYFTRKFKGRTGLSPIEYKKFLEQKYI
ncbi:MAG: helix-turn-helix domain-containing protein [Eubacterium sp.]